MQDNLAERIIRLPTGWLQQRMRQVTINVNFLQLLNMLFPRVTVYAAGKLDMKPRVLISYYLSLIIKTGERLWRSD